MPNIYKGDIGFKGQQAQIITSRNIGEDLNYSVNSGTLLLTDKKSGDMFSYVDEPQKLENYSAGRLKTTSPPLYCPSCAAQLIGFTRGKRKITIPFCPLCAPSNLVNYSSLTCNAYENNAIKHFDAEHSQGYDDRDDESIGMRHRGRHKQSLKDRRDESKGMTDHDDPHHPYSDVSTMSAELTGSQYYPVGEGHILGDITSDAQYTPLGSNAEETPSLFDDWENLTWDERIQLLHDAGYPGLDDDEMSAEYDSPYGERQTTVFGLVGGGNDFAQNRAESLMDTTSDEVMPFGVIGGGNDFGQNLAEDFGSEYHLTEAERNRLPKSDFAMPSERKYPMPNTYYAKKALTYAKWPNNRGDLREVERNVLAKYPSLDGWWSKHRPKNAETFGAESKGTNMWMMAAMAAVGFVAGISLKDLNTDIDSQES